MMASRSIIGAADQIYSLRTTGQTLATQKALLKAAGVERVFSEKTSGAAARRPELERALNELEAGDVLLVTKLDRLARSTLDLLRIIELIGKEGAGFKSLGDPWADTTTAHGRLIASSVGGRTRPERLIFHPKTSLESDGHSASSIALLNSDTLRAHCPMRAAPSGMSAVTCRALRGAVLTPSAAPLPAANATRD